MIRWLPSVVVILAVISICFGDITMHNPRGSNNRLNERQRDRQNANRLYDSQNNARGGYNVGVQPMYYYAGSHLQIQWANQHSCGDQNNNCEVVIQYMCGDNIKAGTSGKTVPLDQKQCENNNCDEDEEFGTHESFHYLEKCASRERNTELYTADQKVSQSAKSTRQNPKGARYGYECAEEKDYYPYWGPSPWRDVAILTNNPERCEYYKSESQNVKGRYECVIDDPSYWKVKGNRVDIVLFQTKERCEAAIFTKNRVDYSGKWIYVEPHGIPAPDCRQNQWSRDNHQGNTVGGQFMKYDWHLPLLEDEEATCVLRIRYNISTNDYDSWNTDSSDNEVTSNTAPATMKPESIWNVTGMDKEDARMRQYILKNNPMLAVFGLGTRKLRRLRFRLAINTQQYGRTFQDRSHPFTVKHRPKAIKSKVIHNLNVRGKRGNLQQVFPSTEYDFVPNKVLMTQGEMIHFQWTGADTNPGNNAGNGKAGTDRSNIVALAERTFPYGDSKADNLTMKTNYPLRSLNLLGLPWQREEDLAFLERCTGEDPLLDEKSAYFDLGPQQIDRRGMFYYMSTRNNQFTNRAQKASITVGETYYNKQDKGNTYRGYKSKSISGAMCLRWDSPELQEQKFTPEEYPDDGLEENYCRNPGSRRRRREKPWCFISEDEWEVCDLLSETTKNKDIRLEEEEEIYADADEDLNN